MKKLILSLILLGTSATAQASIYTCNTDTEQGKGAVIYLLVMDRAQHQLSIFSQSRGVVFHDNWTLLHANAQMTYPMQPGAEFPVYVYAQDNTPVNWDLVAPETCSVRRTDTLQLKLRSNNGQQITGTIQSIPNMVPNPSKNQQECPTPMPYIAPAQAFTCDKM